MVIVAASILEARPGVGLALLVLTWAAIALLTLIVVSLHIRLQRLERIEGRRDRAAPYGHLIGRSLGEALGGRLPPPPPRLVLFLSPSCPSCERLVGELDSPDWRVPTALIWTGTEAGRLPEVPLHVTFLEGGKPLGEDLGIRVTPFALVADEAGTIVRAAPINSLEPLRDVLRPRRGAASLARSN